MKYCISPHLILNEVDVIWFFSFQQNGQTIATESEWSYPPTRLPWWTPDVPTKFMSWTHNTSRQCLHLMVLGGDLTNIEGWDFPPSEKNNLRWRSGVLTIANIIWTSDWWSIDTEEKRNTMADHQQELVSQVWSRWRKPLPFETYRNIFVGLFLSSQVLPKLECMVWILPKPPNSSEEEFMLDSDGFSDSSDSWEWWWLWSFYIYIYNTYIYIYLYISGFIRIMMASMTWRENSASLVVIIITSSSGGWCCFARHPRVWATTWCQN
jgi:hypothetical protein